MRRRKENKNVNLINPDSMKSALDKLLFLHSNFIFSHIDSHNWKIATYNPCLRPKKIDSSALTKPLSYKKAPASCSRPLSAVCYRVPEICEQFITVSKKALVEKDEVKNKSQITQKKQQQHTSQNKHSNTYSAMTAQVLRKQNKKSHTQQNDYLPTSTQKQRRYPIMSRLKKKRETNEKQTMESQIIQSNNNQFRNIKLRRAMLGSNNDSVSGSGSGVGKNGKENKVWRSDGNQSDGSFEFNAWKVQICDTSQF